MSGPKPVGDPGSLSILARRISTAAQLRAQPQRRVQTTIAQVVIAQLLPDGAVKGGTGMKLRLGDSFTRDSADLDTATRSGVDAFFIELQTALAQGWGHFTGTVQPKQAPNPPGVPAA